MCVWIKQIRVFVSERMMIRVYRMVERGKSLVKWDVSGMIIGWKEIEWDWVK